MTHQPVTRRAFSATLASLALVAIPAIDVIAEEASPAASPSPKTCVAIEDGEGCLPLAPEQDRVDLAVPVFTNPTLITNSLFPIGTLTQVVQLGVDAGERLRVEVTLMPETKIIEWNGVAVENVVSQFVAHIDGRIAEVATDFFAQSDDGAVWYFGEDVFNYEAGIVANTDGTWLAGADGPPGMIMPADPQAGDVYRPENIPGYVFEEVTVLAVDQSVAGPQGPIEGAIVIRELLMDGTLEEKTFAPGYGEFQASTPDELVTIAIGVPLDARDEVVPDELATIIAGAREIAESSSAANWTAAATSLTELELAWSGYRDTTDPPPVLVEALAGALATLGLAVEDADVEAAGQAALDVEQATLDFQMRHASLAAVDLARMAGWTRQLTFDGDDLPAALSDAVILESIWARVAHHFDAPNRDPIATDLASLRAALDSGDLVAVADIAETLTKHLEQDR